MKDRIAVCYSGILRGDYIRCFESFKKHVMDIFIKENYEIDIYIHVWNFIETKRGVYEKIESDESIEKSLYIFNPKDFIIEDYKLFKIPVEMIGLYTKSDNEVKEDWHRNVSDRYGIYQSNKLKNKYTNINYKYVIRNRFDNFFDNNIDIDKLSQENLNLSAGHLYPDRKGNYTNLNNQFAISNNEIMNKFSDYYEHYIELINIIQSDKLPNDYLYFKKLVVHTLLFKFYICEYMKIPITFLNYKVYLLRKTGPIFLNDNKFQIYTRMKKTFITKDLLNKLYN